MADVVKTVEVRYKVTGVKALTEVEKLQSRYITTLKKLNQINRQAAIGAKATVATWRQQTQSLGQLNQTVQTISANNDKFQESLLRQQQAQNQLTAEIVKNTSVQNTNTSSTRQNTQARNASVSATNKSTGSFLKNARTMVFWTVGAASVFRLVSKIRRAFLNTINTLFENTEEYKRLSEAQDKFMVSLIAFLGTEDDWLAFIDRMSRGIERLSDIVTTAAANLAMLKAELRGREDFDVTEAAIRIRAEEPDIGFEELKARILQERQAASEAYNRSLEESAALQEAFTNATDKGNVALDQRKAKIDALEQREDDLDRAREKWMDAQKRREEALADLELERLRRLEDIIQKTQRAFEDLALKGARKREDIEINFRRRLEDIEDRSGESRARAESQLRLKLLAIELKYRERLIRIEENFTDQIDDAIGKRDATAALKAIRTAARERGRAGRERGDARTLAFANFNEQINTQRKALERMREDAIKARQRALDDLRRDQERERQDILRNQNQELEDLSIFLTRRNSDIEADYQRRLAVAEAYYRQARVDYQAFLDTQYGKLQSHIARMNVLSNALSKTGLPDVSIKPKPQTSFATGGAAIFAKPTTARFAERGPEAVFAMPLPSGSGQSSFSGNMNHRVSGMVEGVMAGFEGRLSAAVSQAVLGAVSEVLQ